MFKFFIQRRKKGQSVLEYTVLVVVVLAALVSFQVYIKRGLGGRFKGAADDIGDQFSIGNMNYSRMQKTTSKTKETFEHGITNSSLIDAEATIDQVNSVVMNTAQEYWGGTK